MSEVPSYRWRRPQRFISALISAASPFLFACGGGGDSTQPNNIDRVEQSVGPTGGTVVTPSGAAGVQIPAGVLNQTATITVTELSTPPSPGAGPLTTNLKQYPPFYEFTISPANAQLGDSVRVGVCQVTDPSSPFYAPAGDHPKLKLAHAVGSTIEILQPVNVNDFLRCTGVTANVEYTGWKGLLAGIVNRTLAMTSVRAAYAAHGGLGGKVKSFSPFGAVLDACGDTTGIVVGTPANGVLESTDCSFPGSNEAGAVDQFKLSLTNQSILKIDVTGNTSLRLIMTALLNQSFEENTIFDTDVPGTSYAVVPAGNYWFAVHRAANAGSMPYTLGLQALQTINGCPINSGIFVYIYPGITLDGSIASNDCTGSAPNVLVDHYEFSMTAGRTYTMSASGNGLALELGLPNGSGGLQVLRQATNASGGVSITYTATASDSYVVNVLGFPTGKTGPYTLRIIKQ